MIGDHSEDNDSNNDKEINFFADARSNASNDMNFPR